MPSACDDSGAVLDLVPEDGHLQVVLLFCMVFTLLAEGPSSACTSSCVPTGGCAAPDAAPLRDLLCKLLLQSASAPQRAAIPRCSTELLCTCLCSSEGQGGSRLRHANAMLQASVGALVELDQLAGPSGLLLCSNAPAGAQHLHLQQRYMQPCNVLFNRLMLAGVLHQT